MLAPSRARETPCLCRGTDSSPAASSCTFNGAVIVEKLFVLILASVLQNASAAGCRLTCRTMLKLMLLRSSWASASRNLSNPSCQKKYRAAGGGGRGGGGGGGGGLCARNHLPEFACESVADEINRCIHALLYIFCLTTPLLNVYTVISVFCCLAPVPRSPPAT